MPGNVSGWLVTAILALATAYGPAPSARAQFNTKTPDGRTVAVQPNPAMAATNPNASTVYQGANMNAGVVNTGREGSTLGYMDIQQIEAWGRAIYHSDGSYTESTNPRAENAMIQETKSANGVLLFRRVINLDAQRRPSEVLVYDGRGLFRYRGEIVYDNQGRFREEVVFDAKNQLLRRRIQEYDPVGRPAGLKIVDDLSKIPADLKLIITREDGYDAEVAQRNQEDFWKEADERKRGAVSAEGAGEAQPATRETGKKSWFKGLFKKSD